MYKKILMLIATVLWININCYATEFHYNQLMLFGAYHSNYASQLNPDSQLPIFAIANYDIIKKLSNVALLDLVNDEKAETIWQKDTNLPALKVLLALGNHSDGTRRYLAYSTPIEAKSSIMNTAIWQLDCLQGSCNENNISLTTAQSVTNIDMVATADGKTLYFAYIESSSLAVNLYKYNSIAKSWSKLNNSTLVQANSVKLRLINDKPYLYTTYIPKNQANNTEYYNLYTLADRTLVQVYYTANYNYHMQFNKCLDDHHLCIASEYRNINDIHIKFQMYDINLPLDSPAQCSNSDYIATNGAYASVTLTDLTNYESKAYVVYYNDTLRSLAMVNLTDAPCQINSMGNINTHRFQEHDNDSVIIADSTKGLNHYGYYFTVDYNLNNYVPISYLYINAINYY